MDSSTYLAGLLDDGVLESMYNGEFIRAGEDIDGETAHAIVAVSTNDSAVLIEVLQRLSVFGVTLTRMTHLRGKYSGCLEVDMQLMRRRHVVRKSVSAKTEKSE